MKANPTKIYTSGPMLDELWKVCDILTCCRGTLWLGIFFENNLVNSSTCWVETLEQLRNLRYWSTRSPNLWCSWLMRYAREFLDMFKMYLWLNLIKKICKLTAKKWRCEVFLETQRYQCAPFTYIPSLSASRVFHQPNSISHTFQAPKHFLSY